MDALCEAGAELKDLMNRQNYDGRTALHVVAARGQLSAVKTLLARGAAIDLQDNEDNAVIHTALLSPYSTDVADIVAAICATEQAKADKSFVKQPGCLRYRYIGWTDPRLHVSCRYCIGQFRMKKIGD